MELREKYNALYRDVCQKYSELRSLKKEFVFISDEDIMSEEFNDEYFDVRNDQTGGTFEVFISKVDEEGIHIIGTDDPRQRQTIGLNDLSSLLDMLSLIELMEIWLKS